MIVLEILICRQIWTKQLLCTKDQLFLVDLFYNSLINSLKSFTILGSVFPAISIIS